MRKPARYEDTLRALGHVLDETDLKGIYVQETHKQIRVSARHVPPGKPKELSFRFEDLKQIVDNAHSRRGTTQPKTPKASTYENMLRLLGHDLDASGCEAFFISEYDNQEVRVRCRGPSSFRMSIVRVHRRNDLARALEEALLRRTS